MPTVNFTVAEPTARRIDERVQRGDYPDAATYIADLVARDSTDTAHRAALDVALDGGEASGVSPRTVEQIFPEARVRMSRAGWADAAAAIAVVPENADEAAWQSFGVEDDALTW